MNIIELPNTGGDCKINCNEEEIEMVRNEAFHFISSLDSTPVIGDKARIAFELAYNSKDFLKKDLIYSPYSIKWIKYFFNV